MRQEIKEVKEKRTAIVLLVFVFIIGLGFLITHSRSASAISSWLTSCNIYSDTTAVTNRIVHLKMSGCAGVQRFQISESPDFTTQASVIVGITSIATDNSYADIRVTYKNGTQGGQGTPYAISPEQRTVKALVVLFAYEDADGRIAGTGAYETPLWANRLIFGDNTIGYDGYYKKNSYKQHVFQSTNGRILLTGDTYPKIVRIPLEKFRAFLSQPVPLVKDEVYAAIEKDSPGFFTNNAYDHVFLLSSDTYQVDRGVYQLNNRNIVYSIPYDKSRSIFGQTIQEVRTSFDASTVVPRYNPQTVEGVWLETDINRIGTNYFTGGSIPSYMGYSDYYYLKLGTPLPQAATRVIIRYMSKNAESVDMSYPDRLHGGSWMQTLFHENYHVLGLLPQFQFLTKNGIGDFYRTPSVVAGYDLMANGEVYVRHPIDTSNGGNLHPASLLNGFHKLSLGYVTPYTLKWGNNEPSLRLFRSEFGDIISVNNILLIKIPLRQHGDPGLASKIVGNYMDSNGIIVTQQNARQYSGEEYLLLELRVKNSLENEQYNFDEGIPSEGLVAYHVIQTNPYGHTTHTEDIVEMIDATPPFSGGFSNTPTSQATFGPGSGVYQLNVPEFWQEKNIISNTHEFDFLLSAGRGDKNLYARFVDVNGLPMGSGQFLITLDDDSTAADRIPKVTALLRNGFAPGSKHFIITYNASNGLFNTARFYLDSQISDRSIQSATGAGTELFQFYPETLSPGTHTVKAVIYDKAYIPATQSISFQSGTPPAAPSAPQNLAGSLNGNSVVLTWQPPASGPASFAQYQVLRNGTLLSSVTSTSYTDTSGIPGLTYAYTAKAISATGVASIPSNVVTLTINALNFTTPLEGDINGDMSVDMQDIILIANDFSKTNGFNPKADTAAPFGVINIFDIMVAIRNFT